MDQRRTSGFSLNAKFRNMHQMVSDKKLKKEIGDIEQEFAKDVSRLRKETLEVQQDYFKLKKEKGSLNAKALHQLEFSPGLQDRNTRSRRYGAFDPAMLKARDEEVVSTPPKEDKRTFAEKRRDELLQKQLSSVPIGDFENEEKITDPYRRSLDRILGNSKLAKEARLTAMKVKALDAFKTRTRNDSLGFVGQRHDPADTFTDSVYRRSRILSMPVSGSLSQKPHLLARRSMSDGLYRSRNSTTMGYGKELPAASKQERVRKRSNSMVPPTSLMPVDENVLRRRSDTPVYSGKIRLGPLNEQKSIGKSTSVSKLPDVVDNW